MQSNNILEMCECGIAYAQIGRKLFSCSDDNVAFPRSWVISLRDLKLCDDAFFPLSPPYSHYFISLMGECVCVCVCLWYSLQAKHITMMKQNGMSLANIFSKRKNENKCILLKWSHNYQLCPMALRCITLHQFISFSHTPTKMEWRNRFGVRFTLQYEMYNKINFPHGWFVKS